MELGPLQKEWLKALRSGKYKQGTKALKRQEHSLVGNSVTNSFCCLGVLGEILPDTEWRNNSLYKNDHIVGLDIFENGFNPVKLNNGAGLFQQENLSKEYKDISDNDFNSLTEINDNLIWTFDEIADFIEQEANAIFTESI